MSRHNIISPEFLERLRNLEFVSPKKINCEDYKLTKFMSKIKESDETLEQNTIKRIMKYTQALEFIWREISLILSRIDKLGTRINLQIKLENVALDRSLTKTELEELDKLYNQNVVSYLALDMKMLFVWIESILYNLARLIATIVKKEGLRDKSFSKFMGTLDKLKDGHFESLHDLILKHTTWFEDLKNLRDDYSVHWAAGVSALMVSGRNSYVTLTTTKGAGDKETKEQQTKMKILKGTQAKDINMKLVDQILIDLKEMIRQMDNFFCENYSNLL